MESFERDGLAFDVRESGPADGDVVVPLHGFPQDGTAYDGVVPLLADAGLRVLVPDQRGYSPGARPQGRRAYVADELVADVDALLDAAGAERAHVVGHDWGGAVAWAFAARHPERTRSLTALSTPHLRAVREAVLRSDQAARSTYIGAFQVPRVPERTLLADGGTPLREALTGSGLAGERADHYVARMLEPGALTAALAWYRAIPLSGWWHTPAVTVPTILLHGRTDRFFAERGIEATRRWVEAPLVTIGVDGGHWLPEMHAADVASAVLAHADRTPHP